MIRRIQRKRTKGWRMPPNTVYVGRPTKWGNPCRSGSPAQRVVSYAQYLTDNPNLIADTKKELRGRNLACYCPLDQPCHVDVLLKLANS